MTPTTEFQSAIEAIVKLAHNQNPAIGVYKRHFYDSNFNFRVQLENGGMDITSECATDVSKGAKLSEAEIIAVVSTFEEI